MGVSEPGPDFCPTCQANAPDDQCATPTGRDHPSRRLWSRAFRAGVEAGAARVRATQGADSAGVELERPDAEL